ncbi:MAG: NAD(P)/FAD-dependent oxidoreductase [Actinomycetota bacterium]
MTTAVVVGSGPNGLAAAITLADAGVEVVVVEAADQVGGGMRSGELTLPGLVHDRCSAAHPFAVDNAFSRTFDLREHGLRWRWADVEYAHPLDDGRGAVAVRDVDRTAAGLGPRGAGWAAVFGPLAHDFGEVSADVLGPVLRIPDHPIGFARFGLRAAMPASLLARRLRSEAARALWAGVAAHAFRPFSAAMSSAIGVGLGVAAHRYGWPVAEGGSRAIASAMVSKLEDLGGRIETGRRVTSVREIDDADIVMLDVAPAAAAGILGDRLSGRVARAFTRYRHGPGAFKVDWAVDGGIPWQHEESRRAGTVHVGGTLEEISDAERLCARGGMPDRPFVLVCQQAVADPTRARGEAMPVYGYAHVPAGFDGDATAAIEAQIERYAPGFRDRILARHVTSTAQLSEQNANFVGGDIVTGATDLRQLVFRPRPALDPYSTGVPGVFLCSAATPPGAGAHGMCGYNAASSALRNA